MSSSRAQARKLRALLASTGFLLFVGVMAVYSASSFVSITRFGNSYRYVLMHLVRVAFALGLAVVAFRLPYRFWKRMSLPIYLASLALMLLTVVPGSPLSVTLNGATRWLRLGPFMIMPSELLRLGFVLLTATLVSQRLVSPRSRGGVATILLLALLPAALMLFQPDFAGAVLLCLTMLVMLFLSEARLSHVMAIVLLLASLAAVAVAGADYRLERVFGWQNSENGLSAENFQPNQACIALGSGGLRGRGLGRGRQQRGFLPEAFSDFILAVIGEEAGFLGTSLLIAVMLVLSLSIWGIASDADDCFGSLVCGGVAASYTLGALLHAGVCTKLLPATGVPLPLVSWGGTNLIVTLLGLGIAANVARSSGRW
ncbi:FtsW/RodA/SpoVE family cell cycle protein [Candidatus Fermentibacterales bacterium]|nr:FtsW/RodA/SpoVE family cell cycle protein [Candidatus Fermentibacterales bacterium]